MKRVVQGIITISCPAILAGAAMDQGEGSAQPAEPHHTPVDPIPSTSQPPHSPHPSLPHPSPPHPSLPHPSPPHPSPLHQSPPHFSPPRSYKAPLPEEGEEPEDQGRKIQDINDDPLVSLVKESMKEKLADFVSPTKALGRLRKKKSFQHSWRQATTCQRMLLQRLILAREEINCNEEFSTRSAKEKSVLLVKAVKGKRKASNEDWDVIRAKLEANAELSKDVLGKDLPEQDFAKRMVDMVNQRKKHFAEERAKAKRNKPMTQSQYEEELQTKTSKKQRFDDKDVPAKEDKVAEVKEEEPVKRTGKRKKQKARKEQTATGKENSNPLIADSLLKTISEALSSSKPTASIHQYMAWTTSDTRFESTDFTASQELSPTDSLMQDDSIPDEQVHLFDDEDSGNDHLPKADSRQDWWKPLPEEKRPATPEPSWTIPSCNVSDIEKNWASTLVSTYETPAENSLLTKTGDMTTFMKWYRRQVNKTMLTQADFEGQAYEVVKAFYPDVIHLQF
ncbi:hypothetical protein Tco_0294095 [Tanacetum coccineum]